MTGPPTDDDARDVGGETLSPREASDAVSGLGWRYVLGILLTSVRVGSLTQAADVAARVVAAAGRDADEHLWLDIRRERLVITLQSQATASVTAQEVELARRISAVVRELGLATDTEVAGVPRSVQVLEVAIDALDIAAIRPFWKAILGYGDEAGRAGPTDPLVDPVGQARRSGSSRWTRRVPSATASTSTSPSPTTRHPTGSRPHWPRAAPW